MVQQPSPAHIYEAFTVTHLLRPWTHDLLQRAAPQPGEHVLDVACGTGIVARLAAPFVGPTGSVSALDISPALLAVGEEQATAEGVDVTWYEGNAMALPFSERAFDLVFCQQGLQYFTDKPIALREMRRVLTPGGRVIISTWRSLAYNPVMAVIARATAGGAGFAFGDADEVRALVTRSGFTHVAVIPVAITIHYPDLTEFVHSIIQGSAAVSPHKSTLPDDEQDALIATIEDEVVGLLQPYRVGDALESPMEAHITMARA